MDPFTAFGAALLAGVAGNVINKYLFPPAKPKREPLIPPREGKPLIKMSDQQASLKRFF